jgi:hypothetical protein
VQEKVENYETFEVRLGSEKRVLAFYV